MHELLPQATFVLDARWPGNHHALVHATQLGGVLLEPAEWGIKRPAPASRHVVIGLVGAPNIVKLHLRLNGQFVEAIEESHLIGGTQRTAFGAGAIVAVYIDNKRVIELA